MERNAHLACPHCVHHEASLVVQGMVKHLQAQARVQAGRSVPVYHLHLHAHLLTHVLRKHARAHMRVG